MSTKDQLAHKEIAVFGLMVLGLLVSTVGADIVVDGSISAFLAILGGVAVALGGVWGYRRYERRGDYDERYHQIALRGGGVSLWVFYWAVFVWSQVGSNTEITTPILSPLTWLLAVPWVAFGLTYLYYTRVM